MNKLLEKLAFWRQGDKPESSDAVSEQRPNDRYRDSQGNPTPEALDEQQAATARGQFVDEAVRKSDEDNNSPRYDA
jgi:hypothetical protein